MQLSFTEVVVPLLSTALYQNVQTAAIRINYLLIFIATSLTAKICENSAQPWT
jgi:hypothetical protein